MYTKKEFIINKYLKLKLEDDRTVIYVNERRFNQCKYLLLNIPVEKIEETDSFNSIDEAAEKLDHSLEQRAPSQLGITPKVEFWAHSSNLQAWAVHDYDTRLLHSNLAFPLLKALVDAGDSQANRVFKEEIAIRFNNGTPNVKIFLVEGQYLQYFNQEELSHLFKDFNFEIFHNKYAEITPLYLIHLACLNNKIVDKFVMQEFYNFIIKEEGFPLEQIIYSKFLKYVSNDIFNEFTFFLYELKKVDPKFFDSRKNHLDTLYDDLKGFNQYKKATEIKYFLLLLGPANWDDWYNLAMDCHLHENRLGVLLSCEQIIKVCKNKSFDILLIDPLHFEIVAGILIKYKEFDKAIDIYLTLRDEYSDNLTYFKKLGQLYLKNKEYSKAEWNLLRAYRKKKNDSQVLIQFGNFYFQQNNFKKALRWFKRVLIHDFYNIDALSGLSACYEKLGKIQKAHELQERIVRIPFHIQGFFIDDSINLDYLMGENEPSFPSYTAYDEIYKEYEFQDCFQYNLNDLSFRTSLYDEYSFNIDLIDIKTINNKNR